MLYRVLICMTVALAGVPANAAQAWYRGGITRIYNNTGNDFILTLDSGVLSDCQYAYVVFKESLLGTAAIRNAYALALTAKAAGLQFGTVIDKAINGAGGECDATAFFDAS